MTKPSNRTEEEQSFRDGIIILSIFGVIAVAIWKFITSQWFFSWVAMNPPSKWPELMAPRLGVFFTLALSIIVEALPFLLLGVIIAVIIQRFDISHKLIHRLPKNIILRRIAISCLGIFMPVCECGNVPVARSLIASGMSVPDSIVFLLAAPIINPITFIATWTAFRFYPSMAIWRIGAAFIIANLIGVIIGRLKDQDKLLTPEFEAICEAPHHTSRSWQASISLFRSELWLVLRMLCIGALIAAASQVFIPREAILAIGTNPILSVVAMLILGFVISICSSVDAFFALAYVSSFSIGSLLAFLVAGPMVDIKMLTIMKTTYRWRLLAWMTAAIMILSFIAGLVMNYV